MVLLGFTVWDNISDKKLVKRLGKAKPYQKSGVIFPNTRSNFESTQIMKKFIRIQNRKNSDFFNFLFHIDKLKKFILKYKTTDLEKFSQ